MMSSSVPMGRNQKVVIIGGGPTGLGAATRLAQLGHDNWELLEASGEMGGLAGSVVDEQGFTWDLGGHVIFSHYKYFDELTSSAVDEWYTHQRESWVWIEDRWVPYPFQNNIHRLSNESKQKCLEGLIKAAERRLAHEKPRNFQEWIDQRFGPGLADLFMNPYNYKVWGIRPSGMSAQWMGERVALVDLPRVTNNVVHNKDDLSWGPNAIFKFPGHGGTGEIWKRVARRLPQEKLKLNAALVSIDFESKQITLQDGSKVSYDTLISTMPIDKLIQASNGHDDWKAKSAGFVHSATHIIGIGLAGTPPPHLQGKCWMYFPEANCPFYRVTLFSHYSPNHVPKVEIPPGAAAEDSNPAGFWSLMLEVCESDNKPLPEGCDIVQLSVEGLLNTKLITKDDKIVSKWHKRLEYGYPTPFVGRDELLAELQPKLEALGVFSRGRFGGWKYEVGNQDHSLMQGVEVADRILLGIEEETYNYPDLVNGRKVTSRFYGNGQRLF